MCSHTIFGDDEDDESLTDAEIEAILAEVEAVDIEDIFDDFIFPPDDDILDEDDLDDVGE